MSNNGKHTIKSILQHINSSDRALERAIKALWNDCIDGNFEFHINDAQDEAQFERWYRVIVWRGSLHDRSHSIARQKLAQVKYYGILRRCADEIMEDVR